LKKYDVVFQVALRCDPDLDDSFPVCNGERVKHLLLCGAGGVTGRVVCATVHIECESSDPGVFVAVNRDVLQFFGSCVMLAYANTLQSSQSALIIEVASSGGRDHGSRVLLRQVQTAKSADRQHLGNE